MFDPSLSFVHMPLLLTPSFWCNAVNSQHPPSRLIASCSLFSIIVIMKISQISVCIKIPFVVLNQRKPTLFMGIHPGRRSRFTCHADTLLSPAWLERKTIGKVLGTLETQSRQRGDSSWYSVTEETMQPVMIDGLLFCLEKHWYLFKKKYFLIQRIT